MAVVRLRRRVINFYNQRCRELDSMRLKKHPTVEDSARAAFGIGPSRPAAEATVVLPCGEEVTLKLVCELLLPTVQELGHCGYRFKDIQAWLNGEGSDTPFGRDDFEGIFLGIPLGSRRWCFQKRSEVSRYTEWVFNEAWRTTRTGESLAPAETEAALAPGGGSDGSATAAPPRAGGGGGGSGSNLRSWEQKLWKDAETLSRNIEDFDIDRTCCFDRIAQIIKSMKEKFRLLPVSPESRDELERLSELPGIGQTSMRLFDKELEMDKVRGKDVPDTIKLLDPLSINTTSTTRQIIPLRAAAWRGATGTARFHLSNLPGAMRTDGCFAQIGIDVSNLAQQRLDQLTFQRSLPAANPLTSSVVISGPPIKHENQVVYINTGFFVKFAGFNEEVDRFLGTIPGVRCQMLTDLFARFHVPSQTLSAVDDGATDGAAHAETNFLPAYEAIQKTAARIRDEARTEPSDTDIRECLSKVMFQTGQKRERVFDKISIYYTFQAHKQVCWLDGKMFSYFASTFKHAFANEEAVRSVIPETITRFFELESETSFMFPHTMTLLSSPKRLERSGGADSSAAAGDQKGAFSTDELAAVQQAHFNANGEWVDDLKELRKLALLFSSSPDASRVEMCYRHKWREAIVDQKIKSGMIQKNGDLKMTIADTGMNLIRAVRTFHAKNPHIPSGVASVDKRAAFLRPFKVKTAKGTCADAERSKTRLAIQEAIEAANGVAGGAGAASHGNANGESQFQEVEMGFGGMDG